MTCRSLAPVVSTLVLAACFAGENPASGGDAALVAAREQVTQRLNGYMSILTTGNADEVANYWLPDGKVFEPEIAMSGAELVPFAKEFLATNSITDFKLNAAETVAHDGGAVVYVLGSTNETMQAKDGKTPPTAAQYQFLMRWVKGEDGEYRLQHLVGVSVPKGSTAASATPTPVSPPARAIDERLARQQVDQRMKDYLTMIRAGDPAGVLGFWHDDGWFFEPEMQYVSKAELGKAVETILASNRVTSLNVNPTDIFVHDQGSVAYHFGNYEEVIEAKDGKTPPVTIRNNYASRWRRGTDNVWRIDRFFATPQPKAADEHAH